MHLVAAAAAAATDDMSADVSKETLLREIHALLCTSKGAITPQQLSGEIQID